MASPIDALQNAARLKASPSTANTANYDDIFAGPAAGHVPSAFEQRSNEANMENAATSLGAGSAITGLRHAADESRLQGINDELGQEAELSSGRPGRIAGLQAGIKNTVGDQLSEGSARRSFLPWAEDVHQRDEATSLAHENARYGAPAEAKAVGDIGAARVGAQGRIDAANAAHTGDPQRQFANMINEYIAKNGAPPTPEIAALLKSFIGLK